MVKYEIKRYYLKNYFNNIEIKHFRNFAKKLRIKLPTVQIPTTCSHISGTIYTAYKKHQYITLDILEQLSSIIDNNESKYKHFYGFTIYKTLKERIANELV